MINKNRHPLAKGNVQRVSGIKDANPSLDKEGENLFSKEIQRIRFQQCGGGRRVLRKRLGD